MGFKDKIKNTLNKKIKVKDLFKFLWDILVILAIIKITIFVFVSCTLVYMLAMVYLAENGTDISWASRLPFLFFSILGWLTILGINWTFNISKSGRGKQ